MLALEKPQNLPHEEMSGSTQKALPCCVLASRFDMCKEVNADAACACCACWAEVLTLRTHPDLAHLPNLY